MSKQAAAPQAGVGGERPNRGRATNTAPSTQAAQPPTRHRNASVQSERRQAVQGALRDGAGTSAIAEGRPRRAPQRVTYNLEPQGEAHQSADRREEQATGHVAAPRKPKPSNLPPWQTRQSRPAAEQPPDPVSYPYGSVPGERWGAPPRGSSPTATEPPVDSVIMMRREDGTEAVRAAVGTPPPPQSTRPGSKWDGEPSLFLESKRKTQPMEFCLTACCILFWLLVIIVGVAVLVVYLIYRPQPPRLLVTSATLNAGYIDELGVGEMALNSDLTVLAAISNPNTKIHIVLHYMQLDLYFHGSLIGTQAVWPAPLHEGPGGNVLRNVHVVVSEVTLSQEDVMLWRNATAKGGPVALQLYGQFRTQLNFGRWFPFKYTVYPRCTLWLDPPPSGALRRARC